MLIVAEEVIAKLHTGMQTADGRSSSQMIRRIHEQTKIVQRCAALNRSIDKVDCITKSIENYAEHQAQS